jgi:hypothetical protein
MKSHYVYKVILPETNEFYIGSRSCNCKPLEDVKYKGSMKTWIVDKRKLIKKILREFDNRNSAMLYESELINKYINNKLNKNFSIPPFTFHTTGKDCSGNKNGFSNKKHTDKSKKKVSEKMSGINNPSYNKKWIHNENGNVLYIKKEELECYLNNGWKLGNMRITFNATGRKWIHNNIINKLVKKEMIDKYLENGWKLGRILTDEAFNIIKNANLGRKMREENKKIMSLSNKNKNVSRETRNKMSEQSKNRIWIHKNNINKYIKKYLLNTFLEENWII